MTAALSLDPNPGSRAHARGPETASGIFFRSAATRARKIRRKSLKSRRVARPAATKCASGVRYYGRRYYEPKTGRWLSRDPAEEFGGMHLYGFVQNNPIGKWDFLGMWGSDGEGGDPFAGWGGGEGSWVSALTGSDYGATYWETHTVALTGRNAAPGATVDDPTGTGGAGNGPDLIGMISGLFGSDNVGTVTIGTPVVVPDKAATPNSGFDPVLADAVINGSADFRTASKGRGIPARAANPAQIELSLMRQIGAERDPVRRSVLETQLARFQNANSIRPPGIPQDLQISANNAASTTGPGRGPAYGTRVHSVFEIVVNALPNTARRTEVSYLNGQVVPRGTKGSVRIDVLEGPRNAPTAVYDLKTGSALLTTFRIEQIQRHVPGGANVPVILIRPGG